MSDDFDLLDLAEPVTELALALGWKGLLLLGVIGVAVWVLFF